MKKKKVKREKTPTYQVTMEDIRGYVQQGYDKGRSEAIQTATDYSIAVPILALMDGFGFGRIRIERFLDIIYDTYDSIDKGYLNLDDIVKTIKEEKKVEIIRRN